MKRTLLSILSLCLIVVGLIFVPQAQAQTQEWTDGVCVEGTGADAVATIQGVQCLLANVLSIAITAIGLAGFVLIIVGAFKYMLSGGNSKTVEEARGTITMAVVGLVVVLSAFIILNLIESFTGLDGKFTRFVIPSSESGFSDEASLPEPG